VLIQPLAIDPITDHLKEIDNKINEKKRVNMHWRKSMKTKNRVKKSMNK
jgi:hypothetical protein